MDTVRAGLRTTVRPGYASGELPARCIIIEITYRGLSSSARKRINRKETIPDNVASEIRYKKKTMRARAYRFVHDRIYTRVTWVDRKIRKSDNTFDNYYRVCRARIVYCYDITSCSRACECGIATIRQ